MDNTFNPPELVSQEDIENYLLNEFKLKESQVKKLISEFDINYIREKIFVVLKCKIYNGTIEAIPSLMEAALKNDFKTTRKLEAFEKEYSK